MESIVRVIEGSAASAWVLDTGWLWPLLEIVHFIGLALLLGGILIADLRLAGYLRRIDLAAVHGLLRWSVAGFGLNLLSGALFFLGDPARYSANVGFRIKMVLVVTAGLNAAYYAWKIAPALADWGPQGSTPLRAKIAAWTSLATWTGVLVLGRLIPYVGTG